MSNIKRNIKDLTLDELKIELEKLGEEKYRASQIFNWIYNHLVKNFDDMQNIPKLLRQKLSDNFEIESLRRNIAEDSPTTQTKKYLLETVDSKLIESVVIPEKDRNTLCISTQVGCPLDCKFCATGLMGYKRNLTAAEIVDQYLIAAEEYGKTNITNIVYMGMGEPLLNFKNTLKSLRIFTDENTTALSRNRITVSTAGIPPKIIELANSGLRVKLAFSLHSCFDEIRDKIMPINIKYPLQQNFEALRYYADKTKTRITFEYTMLKSYNDRPDDIKALKKLCSQLPSKINIIPFNSIAHMAPDGLSAELEPTPYNRILKFADELRNNNITVMLRQTLGDDIAAACGQLAIKN